MSEWRRVRLGGQWMKLREDPPGVLQVEGMDLDLELIADTLSGEERRELHLPKLMQALMREGRSLEELLKEAGSLGQSRLTQTLAQTTKSPMLAGVAMSHRDSSIRSSAACNPNLHPISIELGLKDSVLGVRQNLARRRGMDERTRRALMRDVDRVRFFITVNNDTPDEVLLEMADDPDYKVATGTALNRHAPPEVLEKVTIGLATADEWPDPEAPNMLVLLLQMQELPERVLFRVAREGSDQARELLAAREPALPDEVIEILARDPSTHAKRELIEHQPISPELAERMAEDSDFAVREKVAERLWRLLCADTQWRLARDPELWVRSVAVERGPAEMAAEGARDPDIRVRVAAAQNPNCPPEVAKSLERDVELLSTSEGVLAALAAQRLDIEL